MDNVEFLQVLRFEEKNYNAYCKDENT